MLSCPTICLQLKLFFLLALASGDRRSAIAALSFNSMDFSTDKVCNGYDTNFVPKSYFVKKNLTRIQPLTIPKIQGLDANPVGLVRTLFADKRSSCKIAVIRTSMQAEVIFFM